MTEKDVLVFALNTLFESVPCCECCSSDDRFMDLREEILDKAKEIGIEIELDNFDCYRHEIYNSDCSNCKKYSSFKVKL